VRADFRGWVQAPYFQNAVIQFFSGGRWIRARIAEVIPHRPKKSASSARSFGADAPPEAVIARVREPVGVGSPGMWALGDAVVRDNRLHARACDDVAGLSAILCMLDAICRKPTAVPCYAFFTRAEEVGFGGALAAVSDRTVPRSATVVAVECSKAIAGVAMGDGPILRVGDKASIFTPAATGWCQVVAERLAARDSSFAYQRKLMDGGTCESTAYCHYGYQATGVCLALGNYHNMDTDRKKVGPEFIDIRDFDNLVKWFVALAAAPAEIPYEGVHPGLDARLTTLLKEHRPRLLKSARSVARAGA
jgi:endoglucanase